MPGYVVQENVFTANCQMLFEEFHNMNLRDPLVDSFGRVHSNLRISVTDRCNIRCFYCMPEEHVQFKPRQEILSFEEIQRCARIATTMGVNKLRITGGEPLVRSDLPDLIGKLAAIPGIEDLALTTNGILLAKHAQALKQAGLHRVNISLDTLREETFQRITRRTGLRAVLDGIEVARQLGFRKLRLNAVAIAGLTEDEVVPLGQFARDQDLELRFIEFMPLDAENQWETSQVLSGALIRESLENAFGRLVPLASSDPSQPAVDYRFADKKGTIGFINPVSQPFCDRCNRLRLTADGKFRNCLFSARDWDVRQLLRDGGTDQQIAQVIRQCVAEKRAGHGIDQDDFVRPERAMYQIGG